MAASVKNRRKKKERAGTVMIQGTASHAGKSLMTAALLRILKRRGVKAAPFKAQNMALNSFVTADGREIGMAQALQAEAAGIEPTADMNPVLLKPSGDSVSQVIVRGRVVGNMSAKEYHAFKKEAKRFALESLERLRGEYEVVVIEGAGSPAEINLRRNDLANMGIALAARSPVLLVGDIDRGGLFASLVGTMALLSQTERALVKGFIVNKFRGDIGLLTPGLRTLEKLTGVKTLGVVPFIDELLLPEEDSVGLPRREAEAARNATACGGKVRVAVIKLPRISNFTDFDPFRCERAVSLDFIDRPASLRGADIAIIPGSKNTIADLQWLKATGLDRAVAEHAASGKTTIGVCGGFQMLGKKVSDPHGAESSGSEARGLGLLDASTVLSRTKRTRRVEGRVELPGFEGFKVTGYEIHMGRTAVGPGADGPFASITARAGGGKRERDGAYALGGAVWGTYMHGLFENDGFRRALIKTVGGVEKAAAIGFAAGREGRLDRLAATVEASMDMERVYGIIGI